MAYSGNSVPVKEVKVENPEELMRQYKATGNKELRNQLVMHYIQHVNVAIYSMKSILLSNIPFEDFFNQGVLALMDCIERYDPDRGASFDTYSYMGIRGAILKYLRKQNWLPNRLWEARKNITKTQKELEQKLMRAPTDHEIAQAMGISDKKLEQYRVEISSIDTVSFEDLLGQTYEKVLGKSRRLMGDSAEERLLEEEMMQVLADAIDALPPKQKQIISLYYYENLNLREIGEVLGLSQQRVSQIRISALNQLRKVMKQYEKGIT